MANFKNRILEYGVKPADQFLAHPKNARMHPQLQREVIEAMLTKLGWVDDVIVSERTGYLLDGHERVWAALAKGDNEPIPYHTVDVSEEEEAEILAEFDASGMLAYYDAELLDGLLQEVNSDSPAIQKMLSDLAESNGLYMDTPVVGDDPGAQIDRAEELLAKWPVKRGDLWLIGEHKLLCGDSTNADDVARLMGGEKASVAWFDPPFGINLQPQRGLTDSIANDGNIDARALWRDFLPLLHKALNETAHVFLCQDWTEFDWTLPLIEKHFTLKSKIVWFKNVWGIGYYTRPQHEDIIYCWKGQPETITEPVADVWQVARETAPIHAAEKPPELSRTAIEHFSNAGDIVIDWFAGVGGSLVACEQTGRKGRGLELEPKYCAVILERMSGMGLQPQLSE